MAFTRPFHNPHFPLSDHSASLLGRRSLSYPRLVTSGGLQRLRFSFSVARNRKVEDASDERHAGVREDGQHDSILEVGKPEVGGLGSKDGVYEGFEWKWPPWKGLPTGYKLIGTTSLAFVVCNMDKVNLSIAIIPMSHQYGWNSSTAGIIQASFFWGYAMSQLPGGWLAKLLGGRKVLEIGVFSWSLATILVPFAAGFMPGLVLSRILVGIGEGVSPSAATDLIARYIPLQERSRAVAFVFGGLSIGSVLGLLFAPPIIQTFGWESLFYIFGFLGIIWCLAFEFVKDAQSPGDGDYFDSNQRLLDNVGNSWDTIPEEKSWSSSFGELSNSLKDVPWKEFFRSQAVWAMVYTHFCGNWGHYTCLSWLPSYFGEELGLNLTESAWVSVLPPLGSILVTFFASSLADYLILKGVETTKVRKFCQTIAFLSPAICMMLSSFDLGLPHWEVVGVLTSGLALSSFALSGLYCTHQDISPKYASVLFGITSTVGAVPGIIGVALTGFLLDSTHSWSISLFAPSIFFYLSGTVVWLLYASSFNGGTHSGIESKSHIIQRPAYCFSKEKQVFILPIYQCQIAETNPGNTNRGKGGRILQH